MKTPNLKRFAVAIITLSVILAVPIGAAAAPADDNQGDHPVFVGLAATNPSTSHCGAKGTYAYTGFGNTFEGNALGFPAGIASTNGTITLDGNGNAFIREAEVVNGVLLNPAAEFSGTYTLKPDCTFTATLPGAPGPVFVGVVADHGKQIRAMSTIPGVQINYVSTVRVQP